MLLYRRLLGVHRSVVRYRGSRSDDAIIEKVKEIAYERRRFGYRRVHMMLQRMEVKVNHKKVYRIYKACGLKVRKRNGRKRALGERKAMTHPSRPNQRWALDFVHDALASGQKLRLLTVVDVFTRECLKIVVDTALSGGRVVKELDDLMKGRGVPETFLSDNGTEFTSNQVWNGLMRRV